MKFHWIQQVVMYQNRDNFYKILYCVVFEYFEYFVINAIDYYWL